MTLHHRNVVRGLRRVESSFAIERVSCEVQSMKPIQARVTLGLGEAAAFTRLDWVRRQTLELAGIDPHPGTLNLRPAGAADEEAWRALRAGASPMIEPPDASFCRAHCVPVSIGGVPAAIVLPEIAGYPQDKVELIAALHLRDHLALAEGDSVRVEPARPIAAKAVLFDLDGTLVDSIGAYVAIAQQAAQPHGLVVTEAHVRRALSSGTSFWEDVVPRELPDRKDLKRLLSAEAAKHWPAALERHARVFPGVARLLDELRGLGIALGIVSGARPEVMALLRAQGLHRRFDAIVLGEDVARRKPDPEGILKCLERIGVAPTDAVYVGDTPIDMRAGRAAGTRAVGVLGGAADGAGLSRHAPERLIASLDRLRAILAPAHRL